jgi:hypothetical protein
MANEGHPFIVLQVRAFLSGRLALVPHPSGAGHDYTWGRGGMHSSWGLGLPILATPFHVVGRLLGAPGFPDNLRFLILYAVVTVVLARTLHRSSPNEPTRLVASTAAAGFVMVFPAFVGLISARFLIYDQTIATGALWSVLLLAGVLSLLHRCTPGRVIAVCAAAGFSTMIRAPLGAYGLTTAVLAVIVAHRKGVRVRVLLWALLAYAGVTALYLAGNSLRFGSPLTTGYANLVAGPFVNRLTRWGLPFARVPFLVRAKETFATLFLLQPVSSQIMMGTPPASVKGYAVGERWREYYSPTYDLFTFAVWLAIFVIVGYRVVRYRLWRRDRDLGEEIPTVLGAWALPPSIGLFLLYTQVPNMVTRYLVDMYPAFAAASLCVGMAAVDLVRKRVPGMTASVQIALAGVTALYLAGWRGWAQHLSQPVNAEIVTRRIADIDARSVRMPSVPNHFTCNEPRGPLPVHTHLEDWLPDCSFRSGMVFAMPHSRCISFTFGPSGVAWGAPDNESLAGFRANGDTDPLVACGVPVVEGNTQQLTLCDPSPPSYLLDGMRLYAIASLDSNLNAIDRLKLMRIDAMPGCP